MAGFLPKEQVRLQSVGQFQPNTVAKDFATLFNVVGKAGETIQKSMLAESEIAGKLLARDKLIQLRKKKTESADRLNNSDPHSIHFENEKNSFDLEVATALKNAKDKFGADSQAYKTFESHYLESATKSVESYKRILDNNHSNINKQDTVNNAYTDASNLGTDMSEKNVSSIHESIMATGTQSNEQVSSKITEITKAGYINAHIDINEVLTNGKVDKTKSQQLFNHFFGSVAHMDKDGKVTKKHDWMSDKDIAGITTSFYSSIRAVGQKADYNMYWKVNKKLIEDKIGKIVLTNDITKDTQTFISFKDEYGKALLHDTNQPSNSDRKDYLLALHDIDVKAEEMIQAYSIVQGETGIREALSGATGKNFNTGYIKQLVQNRYNSLLTNYINTKDPRYLDAIKSYKNMTGEISTQLTSAFNKLSNVEGTSEQLSGIINMAKQLQDTGYVLPNNSIFHRDIMPQVENILNNKDIKEVDKHKNILTLIATQNENNIVMKNHYVQATAQTIDKTLNDGSFLEATARGGLSWITSSAFSGFNERIIGGATDMARTYAIFLAQNHMIVDPNNVDSIVSTLKDVLGDASTNEHGDPLFPIVKMSGHDVIQKKLNPSLIFGALKDKVSQENYVNKLNKEDMLMKYRMNGSGEIVADIYIKNGLTIEQTPRMTVSYDNYNGIIAGQIQKQANVHNKQKDDIKNVKVENPYPYTDNLVYTTK